MERILGPRVVPPRPPDPKPEHFHETLADIRRFLAILIGKDSQGVRFHVDYRDVVPGTPLFFPAHQGRTSLAIHNNGAGNVYCSDDPAVTANTGIPIANGGEREFEHWDEFYCIADANARVVWSEEWKS